MNSNPLIRCAIRNRLADSPIAGATFGLCIFGLFQYAYLEGNFLMEKNIV